MSKRALLIGINYRGTSSALNGCINDVLNVRTFLTQNCDFPQENVVLMTDSGPEAAHLQPTRVNLQNELVRFVTSAQPGDTLVLHYSGHGTRSRDTSGDETDRIDELIVPLDYSSAGCISDDWLLANVFRRVPVGVNLTVFMDCCHSGTVCDLKFNYKSACRLKTGRLQKNRPYNSQEWTNQFTVGAERSTDIPTNVCMFSGALDREYAEDAFVAGQAQGAFTYVLLQSLRSNLDPATQKWRPNTMRLRHLLKETNCRLDLGGYVSQQCQLSVSVKPMFESFLNL